MYEGRLSRLVSAMQAIGQRLVRQFLILRNKVLLLLRRRRMEVRNFSTDQLAVIRGNAFRLIWDVRHSSHVRINGFGVFLPKGELIIPADFDVRKFEMTAYGRSERLTRTLTVTTLSVGLTEPFKAGYTGPKGFTPSAELTMGTGPQVKFTTHSLRPKLKSSQRPLLDIPSPKLDNPIFTETINHQLRKLTSYET
jgi:hypothetical protein